MHLLDWLHIFYILEKLQIYHQYLMIKMHTNICKCDNYLTNIYMHFYHQALVIDLQFFKYVKYVHSIKQMHLFWLLNIKYFCITFLKYILFAFIFSNQNKRIWLIDCTYFTYLKNCSSITYIYDGLMTSYMWIQKSRNPEDNWVLYMLEKLQDYNQYLVLKMAVNLNQRHARKISNIRMCIQLVGQYLKFSIIYISLKIYLGIKFVG